MISDCFLNWYMCTCYFLAKKYIKKKMKSLKSDLTWLHIYTSRQATLRTPAVVFHWLEVQINSYLYPCFLICDALPRVTWNRNMVILIFLQPAVKLSQKWDFRLMWGVYKYAATSGQNVCVSSNSYCRKCHPLCTLS